MSSKLKSFITHSPEETEEFAFQWAKKITPGANVCLTGSLGAGKTAFVRGFYEGLGSSPDYIVSSPTFTLIHEYKTTQAAQLNHFDLYRLESIDELIDLDMDLYFSSPDYCLVEWGEKFPTLRTFYDYEVVLETQTPNTRNITIKNF